ncbi:hypothetical protein JET14_21860 (plasmid) [Martelella lutilitoris]|uniref:Uncharacterized protein n=1 Tax=Martelella lutilitoris TaxID=2583532 RepID=A0A7T7HPU2_9HYPH|nr:hypothetical protein [Martelella lutilitoris]QQM33104.1 hypothetical protein JET14_21860 [Martelella lutilitoris]
MLLSRARSRMIVPDMEETTPAPIKILPVARRKTLGGRGALIWLKQCVRLADSLMLRLPFSGSCF